MSYYQKDLTNTYTIPLAKSGRSFKGRITTAQLIAIESPENSNVKRLYPIKGPILLGRKKSADIYLKDSKLSRLHAQIYTQGKHYYIKDLNSTNGTKVNGRYITEKRIRPKDIIEIGDIKFEFNFPSLVSRKKTNKSPISMLGNIVKFLFLGTLLISCFMLIYYSAIQPFANMRGPQSLEVKQGISSSEKNWVQTQAELFYEMANQSYHDGNYQKAKHFLWKARQFNGKTDVFKKLNRAIEEALVLKIIYIDELKARKNRKKLEEELQTYLSASHEHINKKEWDLAIISFQEALLIDPENEEAKKGIHNVERLKHANYQFVNKKLKHSTLKTYENIQLFLNKADSFSKQGKYSRAIYAYKNALDVAKKYDFSVDNIVDPMKKVARILKSNTKRRWTNAQTLIEAERYVAALKDIDTILVMNPKYQPAVAKKKILKRILTKKAQSLYSKAVIMESLPDITAAKVQWKTIVNMLTPSHPYYKKAEKKLAKYSAF